MTTDNDVTSPDVNSNNVIASSRDAKQTNEYNAQLPLCRNVPLGAELRPQTVRDMHAILVCTGVYKPGSSVSGEGGEKNYHGHRDFAYNPQLYKPTTTCEDVHEAVEYILEREHFQVI